MLRNPVNSTLWQDSSVFLLSRILTWIDELTLLNYVALMIKSISRDELLTTHVNGALAEAVCWDHTYPDLNMLCPAILILGHKRERIIT